MPKMNGGKAVIEALRASGAEAMFGIPGVHNLWIYDALLDCDLKHYVTRHEQGAGFMADGFARATGRPGVCLPITGPGLTNAATPIAQAFSDSFPMLVISSQVESGICDRQKGTLHELKDQMAFMAQITDWNVRAKDPVDCVRQIGRAYSWFANRRKRPVHIEVPMDVQDAVSDVDLSEIHALKVDPLVPDDKEVDKAAAILHTAENVVIYAGGGAVSSRASAEILKLSKMLGAPIVTTCQGKGSVPEDHPAVLGNTLLDPKVQELLSVCDATVAVGTHFGASNTQSWQAKIPTPIIHIDIDSTEFDKNYPAAARINADAKQGLSALMDALGTVKREGLVQHVVRIKQAMLDANRQSIPWEAEHLDVIRNALRRDDILVCDMTFICYSGSRYYPVYEPGTFMFPRGFGTLGFSPPVAMGAKVARPDANVVAIVGDGGFLFTCQELATAAHYNIPVVMVLVNSNSYEVVKRSQIRKYGKDRTVDVEVKNPDFMRLADSFGVWAKKADCVESFEKTLREALDLGKPALIEIPFAPR